MKLKGYIYVLLPIGVLLMAFAQELRHLHLPTHFPAPQYDFADNPANEEAFQLGRALFYDPGLSADNSISCASCHSPYHAFAHTDHDLSHGIHDSVGTRNAPALFNLAWQSSFMWDGAIQHLDMQALAPISHPGEMGSSLPKVISYLQADTRYPVLFEAAFGDSVISGEYVLKALAQFQLGLISSNAKYDSVQRGESNFTVQEQSGYLLFQQHCNVCHTEPLFMNNGFANNGLSLDSSLMDYGRIAISQQPEDSLQFKIPSLRNLRYTFPYMHDGRFRKLKQVVLHYANGEALKHPMEDRLLPEIQLSEREQVDIIAFLRTLNDQSFVFNRDYHFPREFFLTNARN